jgi:hypothetical protein
MVLPNKFRKEKTMAEHSSYSEMDHGLDEEEDLAEDEDSEEEWESDWKYAQEAFGLNDYKLESHKRFAAEAYVAGFELRNYSGRGFYNGPAVQVDQIGNAEFCKLIRATNCHSIRWDNMGMQFIVYPG